MLSGGRAKFLPGEGLEKLWASYTEGNDEKSFRQFVKGFVHAWHLQVSPNWELLISAYLQNGRLSERTLTELPDEMLPALSKFLFVAKDSTEQGSVTINMVAQLKEIIQCLCIVCRNPQYIPLVASLDFVRQTTQLSTLLLQHLLEMESTFFRPKGKNDPSSSGLRTEIMGFIAECCHFLETLYDPYFSWRNFVKFKADSRAEDPTPTLLHPETIPFLYESFDTALVECFPNLGEDMLNVYGAILSGSRANAMRAISPATTKMLLKTVRDSSTSQEVHIAAIYCSAKSIQTLHEAPIYERQLECSVLVQQYIQILNSLRDKAGVDTLMEAVGVISMFLRVENETELKVILAKADLAGSLMTLVEESNIEVEEKRRLLPVIVNRLSLMLFDCDLSCEQMEKEKGYERLFEIINGIGPPDMKTLKSVLSMATFGGDARSTADYNPVMIKNTKPINYLLKWICETDYENEDQQAWLIENLRKLCSSTPYNKMICCQNDIISQVIDTLKSFDRLAIKSIAELFLLLQTLGSHSITPVELKKIFTLLQEKDEDLPSNFKLKVFDCLNNMALNPFQVCRNYFDVRIRSDDGISIQNIDQWSVPLAGFTFHCWIRFDKSGTPLAQEGQRRILYSLYATSGNGFEAFLSDSGTLTIAVACKKEFLAVPLTETPSGILTDGLWHCIQVCHSTGKRPFGSCMLNVYIDGQRTMECALKYPMAAGDVWSHCQIGCPPKKTTPPPLNLNTNVTKSQKIKDGIMDAIKIGVPGVLILPQSLRQSSSSQHQQWTLIGLEDQLWGKPNSFGGQFGTICVFQDCLTQSLARTLYEIGPNQSLNVLTEDAADLSEVISKLVFSFSSIATQNMVCPNLNFAFPNFEGRVTAKPFCTKDVKDTINCIGGVTMFFPLLERAAVTQKSLYISGFLTLICNFCRGHHTNLEQLIRGGGIYIIGSLLQNLEGSIIDASVLTGIQDIVEMSRETKDVRLITQIYNSLLLDFRIWSRTCFFVQISFLHFLSNLMKEDKKIFRKKFGVQFILDTIQLHYSSNKALSYEDCRVLRESLFSLVKFSIFKDSNQKDVDTILTAALTVKHEAILFDTLRLLLSYMQSNFASDHFYYLMFEQKRADLLWCLLIDPTFSSSIRHLVIRIVLLLLRSNKAPARAKMRVHLRDARYLGICHLRCKNISECLTIQEVTGLLDIMFLFSDDAAYQGALGLAHHLQWTSIDVKIAYCRRLITTLFAKPEAPSQFANKIGWQDCLAKLLVKKVLEPEREPSEASAGTNSHQNMDDSQSGPLSPSHYLEVAANTAKTYLHDPAMENLGRVVMKTRLKVKEAVKSLPQERIAKSQQRASSLLGKVQDLGERASFRVRSATVTTSKPILHESPQHVRQDDFQYSLDDFAMSESKSLSESSDDLTMCRNNSIPSLDFDPESQDNDLKDFVDLSLASEGNQAENNSTVFEKEEELCQLVINALFTIMWRGFKQSTVITEEIIKERGQVISCINMLGLNNELYRSHIELKRNLVEQCIQAVLVDFKDAPQVASSQAEHVMRWAYDLIVLDSHGNFGKKVSECLLDGILNLLECMVVFQEGQQDLEWIDMSKLAFDILLKCMEHNEYMEICSMASAKLHALVQTRLASTMEENGYLICRISKLLAKSLKTLEEDECKFAYLAPVMRALLEKSRDQLNLTVQLPALNLRNLNGTAFIAHFKEYHLSEEWNYFIEKKISNLHEAYVSGYLSRLEVDMNTFWAECYELSQVASHKRNREIGESKLKFETLYLEPFLNLGRMESGRCNYIINNQRSHQIFCLKRWRMIKRTFIGTRGAWADHLELDNRWKLSPNENYLRMRLKMVPNPNFNPHFDASSLRDSHPQLSQSNELDLLNTQIAKAAVLTPAEDILTEDELKGIAIEQMETAESTSEADKASERLLFSEECTLITFMSVVKGRIEATNKYVYFFDVTSYKENEERHDFRWSLSLLKEIHLRRYNLRRTAIEFFLSDHTNYLINLKKMKTRNNIYSRFLGLRLSSLTYSSGRSPADALKSSGLSQQWVNREISNFEYLMSLNTISGRTFNDLSQYPIFPWILSDYTSKKLDLTNPKSFRDLSKPMGVQNCKRAAEVRTKYDQFEDPTGVIAKFHYGTHYSNSAMVLHYMVRVEPFTTLHIDLQSGRFDVADRQFHSIPQTWKNILQSSNDVKELIPEFFCFPEFLLNDNKFDLGHLQSNKKIRVNDVVLPPWAKNPDDFIRKHRQALECEFVDNHLHSWIDLIFGCKQKGQAAIDALNVFFYCTYEGAVNLDAIQDEEQRIALEGMINNFGQTPCQLLKEPHPKRLTLSEWMNSRSSKGNESKKLDIFTVAPDWKSYLLNISSEKDPLMFIQVPREQQQSSFFEIPNALVTISSQGVIGVHGWMSYDKSGASDFLFEIDPVVNPGAQQIGGASRRVLPGPFGIKNNKIFCITSDGKFVIYGGCWDRSLRAYSLSKNKLVSSVVRHLEPISCLALDVSGSKHLITGSKDTTSILWEILYTSGSVEKLALKPIQVLCGHDKTVSCVALSVDLDTAVSGSEDGTVNVYTVKDGIYLRTIKPPNPDFYFTVSQMGMSTQGQIVFSGHSRDIHSIHVFTLNGRWLASGPVVNRITTMAIDNDSLLIGDENGEVMLRDLFTLEKLHSLPLHLPVQTMCLTTGNHHCLIPLRDGKLVIVGALDTRK